MERTPCISGRIDRVCFLWPTADPEGMWNEEKAQRLGVVLRRLRGEAGLSQESLAHSAGITKNQLQLLEAGRSSGRKEATGPSNPRMTTLAGLADILGISISQLLADAEL
jgi:DNA-binding XRE family transcriptional regulator